MNEMSPGRNAILAEALMPTALNATQINSDRDVVLEALSQRLGLAEWCAEQREAFKADPNFTTEHRVVIQGFTINITLSSASVRHYQPFIEVVITSKEGVKTEKEYELTGQFRQRITQIIEGEVPAVKPIISRKAASAVKSATVEVLTGPRVPVESIGRLPNYERLEHWLNQSDTLLGENFPFFFVFQPSRGLPRMLEINKGVRPGVYKVREFNPVEGQWLETISTLTARKGTLSGKGFDRIDRLTARSLQEPENKGVCIDVLNAEEMAEVKAKDPNFVGEALGQTPGTKALWKAILAAAITKETDFENKAGLSLVFSKDGEFTIQHSQSPQALALKKEKKAVLEAGSNDPTYQMLVKFMKAHGLKGAKFKAVECADDAPVSKPKAAVPGTEAKAPIRPGDLGFLGSGDGTGQTDGEGIERTPKSVEQKEQDCLVAFIELFNTEVLRDVKSSFKSHCNDAGTGVLLENFDLGVSDLEVTADKGDIIIELSRTGQQKALNFWRGQAEGMPSQAREKFENIKYPTFKANFQNFIDQWRRDGISIDVSALFYFLDGEDD